MTVHPAHSHAETSSCGVLHARPCTSVDFDSVGMGAPSSAIGLEDQFCTRVSTGLWEEALPQLPLQTFCTVGCFPVRSLGLDSEAHFTSCVTSRFLSLCFCDHFHLLTSCMGRHCSRHVTWSNSLNLHNVPMKKAPQLAHFTDEGTQAQRGEATCPRSHSCLPP